MSIYCTGMKKALMSKINDFLGWLQISSTTSVVGFSYEQHIFGVRFFEFKIWQKKFYELSKTIASVFNAIKRASWRFFHINIGNTAEYTHDPIYQRFFDAMNIQIHSIARCFSSITRLSLTDEKAPITIDQSSKIDNVIMMNFRSINKGISGAHA